MSRSEESFPATKGRPCSRITTESPRLCAGTSSRYQSSSNALSMNIDNAFELDWYRLEVPAHNLGDSVIIRLQGRPFVAGNDSSDLDIYVLSVPGSTGNLTVVDSSVNAGSTENLTMNLAAGSYYLAVVDFAGVPERYSLCIREVPLLTVG